MNNNDERDYEEENVTVETDLEDDYEIPVDYYSPSYFEFYDERYGWDF
jgi:hypothetical protein